MEFHTFTLPSLKTLKMIVTSIPLNVKTDDIKSEIKFNVIELIRNCYWVVRREKYKSGSRIRQCYKYQNFGHVAKNCFERQKRVKCASEHTSNNWNKIPSDELTCANCYGKYAASYNKCEIFTREIGSISRDEVFPKKDKPFISS